LGLSLSSARLARSDGLLFRRESSSLGGGGMLSVNSRGWDTKVSEMIHSRKELERGKPLASPLAWLRILALNFIFQPAGWRLATWLGLHKMGDDEKNWGYHLSRLTPAQARIGLESLANLESLNRQRRRNGELLFEALKDIPGLKCVPVPAGAVPGYLRFPLLVDNLEVRDRVFQQLGAAGIGAGKMYRKTLPEFFPDLNSGRYPGAEYIASHLLTLPVHQYVKEEHIKLMIQIISGAAATGETKIQSGNSTRMEHAD
jgi:dTDP-4-amino-4,6-dideoxygalactose transaminase